MPQAQKFNSFGHQLGKGVHNFETHQLKVALTNVAPTPNDNVIGDIWQIPISGGYLSGGYNLTHSWVRDGALAKLVIEDKTITAQAGTVGEFRYLVIWNSSAPLGQLVGWIDYGQGVTLADGDSIIIDFSQLDGFISYS